MANIDDTKIPVGSVETPIVGRLHDVSEDHVVTGANEVFDDRHKKRQSQINNDVYEIKENYITRAVNDLINYYKKSETYTQVEINHMLDTVSHFNTVIGELPASGEKNTIYFVPNPGGDSYTEYIWNEDANPPAFVPLATHGGDIGAFKSMLNVPDIILDTPYINLGKFTQLSELSLPYVDGVMRTDGTIDVIGTYKTYTIANSDSTPQGRIKVVYSNFEGKTNLDGLHVNVEITDGSPNVVYRGRLQGARAIILQYGYILRLSTQSASQVYVQTTNGNVFYSSSGIGDRFNFIKVYDYSESGKTASEGDLEYINGLYTFGQAINSRTSFSEDYRTYIVDTTGYVKPIWCHFQTPNLGNPQGYRLFCCCRNNPDRQVLYEKSFISPANYIVQLSPNCVYYITANIVNIWDEGAPNYVLERAEMNYLIQPVYKVPQLTTRLVSQRGGWMYIGQKSIPAGDAADYIEYENTANSDVYMFVYGARNIGRTSVYKNITIIQDSIMVHAGIISSGLNVISVPYATKIIVCLYEYGYAGLISKDEFDRITSAVGGSDGTSILCGVGDSLTAGNTYLNILNGLLGGRFTIVNKGIGGESAATIFGRVNSIPYKVAEDIVIPASSSTSIEIKLKNDFGSWLLPLFQQGGNSGDCYIAGIEGTMTTNDSPYGLSATYYFNRKENGVATTVKAGEEILMSSNGVYGGIEPNATQIIWVGQNGGYKYGGETNRYQPENGSATAEDVALLVNMIKQHIEISKPSKFLVLSPPSNTNTILESGFLNSFRGAYINVREQMVLNGIPIALSKGYLIGDYPTEQDSQDIANGIVPSSLRADSVHFNTAGYSVLAELIKVKINTIWNIN